MTTQNLVRIALFAALIAALGLLPRIDLPIAAGVPITAQTLGVMLAGVVLGPRLGALAVLLFLFVVALGAPLLAGGRGGLGVFFGPAAGYLVGWIAGAGVCGLLMHALRHLPLFAATLIAAIGGGILVVYAFGVPWLAWKANLSLTQALLGGMVFVPGDLIKAVVCAAIAVAVHRGAPSQLASRA
jgi:biotin transport system substrate-specific component